MPQEGRFAAFYDIFFGNFLLKRIEENIVNIATRYGCGNFLDLGCGTGMQIALLKKMGIDAIGVDSSPLMVEFARKKKIDCILADAVKTPFPSRYFDCINIAFVLHATLHENRIKILEEMKRLIAEEGIFIITDYARGKKLAAITIKVIERMATEEHYRNYVDYMQNGSLASLIKNLKIEEEHDFFNGAVKTVVARI